MYFVPPFRLIGDPSGDPTPAAEDHAMTEELRDLSYALNVPLQAHVLVTPGGRLAAVLE
ncbi:JAB domain-containing protein [Sorangium sp. So ce367]|uniref:JAB domain-containing protein n=1 Tax=Sorangium sp. So ce367 TaxID=3133305 RepID=UPI003F60474C